MGDGIWERTGNQEMMVFVRPRIVGKDENGKAKPLSRTCGDICDKGLCPSMDMSENESFDGTGCDNMTVMIVQLKDVCGPVGGSKKRPEEQLDANSGGKGSSLAEPCEPPSKKPK